MWTGEHRAAYQRDGGRFPSDLTEAEWARLRPLIPDATPGGRPRKTDMAGGDERHLLSAAHRVSVALSAARLPNIFRKFQREGVWEAIGAELHTALRERLGRDASPSAAVLDSQSLKSAEKGAAKTTQWGTTPARR